MDSVKKTVDTSGQFTGSSDNIIGGYTFTNTNWNTPAPPMAVSQSGLLKLDGDHADIVINGVSLVAKLDAIAQQLNLLQVNPELEQEWHQLRELGDRYRQLEQELKEKSNMWNKLKAQPTPEIKV